MSIDVKGVSDPRPVDGRQPDRVVPEVTTKIEKFEADVVDIAKGSHRITPERVKALLDDSEEKQQFPEPRVFDQNGDGKFNVLDLGIHNPLFSIADELKK